MNFPYFKLYRGLATTFILVAGFMVCGVGTDNKIYCPGIKAKQHELYRVRQENGDYWCCKCGPNKKLVANCSKGDMQGTDCRDCEPGTEIKETDHEKQKCDIIPGYVTPSSKSAVKQEHTTEHEFQEPKSTAGDWHNVAIIVLLVVVGLILMVVGYLAYQHFKTKCTRRTSKPYQEGPQNDARENPIKTHIGIQTEGNEMQRNKGGPTVEIEMDPRGQENAPLLENERANTTLTSVPENQEMNIQSIIKDDPHKGVQRSRKRTKSFNDADEISQICGKQILNEPAKDSATKSATAATPRNSSFEENPNRRVRTMSQATNDLDCDEIVEDSSEMSTMFQFVRKFDKLPECQMVQLTMEDVLAIGRDFHICETRLIEHNKQETRAKTALYKLLVNEYNTHGKSISYRSILDKIRSHNKLFAEKMDDYVKNQLPATTAIKEV